MVVTVRKVSQIPPPPHPRKECCFATNNHIGDKNNTSPILLLSTLCDYLKLFQKLRSLKTITISLKCILNLNSFNPETQAWSWTKLLPPLHVTWLGYSTFPLLLLSGFTGVYFYHLLEQILRKESLLLTIGKCRKGDSFFHSQDVIFSSQHYLPYISH